jgi:hypothetical protein
MRCPPILREEGETPEFGSYKRYLGLDEALNGGECQGCDAARRPKRAEFTTGSPWEQEFGLIVLETLSFRCRTL